MTVETGWGWCRSCQCLFSFDAPDDWSCATGGHHNRSADPDAPYELAGEFSLTRHEERKPVVLGPDTRPKQTDTVDQAALAHWPLAHNTEEVNGLITNVLGDVHRLTEGAHADEGYRFSGGSLLASGLPSSLTPFTLTWWMQADTKQQTNATILDYSIANSALGDSNASFVAFLNNGRLGVHVQAGGDEQQLCLAEQPLPPSRRSWVMCAITVAESVTFYANGQATGESTLVIRPPLAAEAEGILSIGRRADESSLSQFAGSLTDLRIYGESLDNYTIQTLFDTGSWRVQADSTRTRYELDDEGREGNWLKCTSCGLLVHDGPTEPELASSRRCSAHRAGHEPDNSASYSLAVHTGATPPEVQSGWTRCSKCAALFFAPFGAESWCATGGHHTSDGSSYLLTPLEGRSPQFAEVDTRGGSAAVLFLGANEAAHTQIGLSAELGFIEEALDTHDVAVRGILNAKKSELSNELQVYGPDIVHISAHGIDARAVANITPDADDDWEPAGIYLLDDGDKSGLTTGEELAKILDNARDVHGKVKIQVVILNVCRSAPKGQLLADIAPFVVAVDGDIPDPVAQVFSPMFYSEFVAARGTTVEKAATALASAQSKLGAYFDESKIPRRILPHKE